jgi:hypothetical protein
MPSLRNKYVSNDIELFQRSSHRQIDTERVPTILLMPFGWWKRIENSAGATTDHNRPAELLAAP